MNNVPGWRLLRLNDEPEWRAALNRLPLHQRDIYFTPGYYRLFASWQGGEAACFLFEHDGDLALYPFLMGRLEDAGYLPGENYYDLQGAYGYNGVITSNKSPEFASLFHQAFKKWCYLNHVVAEFTRFHPLLRNEDFSSGFLTVEEDRRTVMLPIGDFRSMDEIRAQYRKETRKNVRKAQESKVTWRRGTGKTDWLLFGSLYRSAMEHLCADEFYLFSDEFFQCVENCLSGGIQLFLYYNGDELIGGFTMLTHGDYAHNFLSAVSPSWEKPGISEWMQDTAMHSALEQGCRFYHLGGGSSNQSGDSLLHFKAGFSKEIALFCTGKKIHLPEVYQQVIQQWRMEHPALAEKFGNRLLSYRIQ
jgi:hypothetical protein